MRTVLIILSFLLSICANKLNAQLIGVSATMGYSPFQTLESDNVVKKDGKTIHADIQFYNGFDLTDCFDIGIIGGVGIRSYNISGFKTLSSDPYKKRATRFDIHVGPSMWVGIPENYFGLLVHPQIGWGFGGYHENAPKSYFAFTLNADIMLGNWATIGVTYRPLRHTITSSISDPIHPASVFHLVQPAWEFRVGFFHFFI